MSIRRIKMNNQEIRDEEVWVKIPEHENYEISNYGRVRSLPHIKHVTKSNGTEYDVEYKGRALKTFHFGGEDNRYLSVLIEDETISIHRMVAKLFIPNDNPKKTHVDHINGDPEDNYYGNLRWVTHKENLNAFRNHMVHTPQFFQTRDKYKKSKYKEI